MLKIIQFITNSSPQAILPLIQIISPLFHTTRTSFYFSFASIMAQLYDILLTAGVQETFADKLRDDGWTTELYAMCATNQENFKEELTEMLGTFYAVTTPIQRSALTLAWHRCRQSVDQPAQSSSSQPVLLRRRHQLLAGPRHFPPS